MARNFPEHTLRQSRKDDYSKVDRKKSLKNAEYFANNDESIMNTQGQNVKNTQQTTKATISRPLNTMV